MQPSNYKFTYLDRKELESFFEGIGIDPCSLNALYFCFLSSVEEISKVRKCDLKKGLAVFEADSGGRDIR